MAENTNEKAKVNNYHLKKFYTNIMKDNALLYKNQFIVDFIGLEQYGITSSTEPVKNITYYVQSASIPGYQLVNGKTTFMGTEFRIPGVLKYNHSWSVNILLNENMFAYVGLQTWRRYISRLEIDGGGIKTIPNVQARVSVLSPDHQQIVNSYILEGVWIKELGEINLAYANGGGNVMKCTAQFRYQYVYPDYDSSNVNSYSDKDPLGAGNNKPLINQAKS